MEREFMFTGIGGQGVQLGASVLGHAATLEDRFVMLFGMYGGEMRGGTTDSTLVIADEPISAPPIVSKTWGAIVMHHEYWVPTRDKLRPGSAVFLNSTLFADEFDRDPYCVVEVPATAIASDLGAHMAGAMVMVGAVAASTGLVSLDSLVAAMKDSLPSYRKQHAPLNEKALSAGFEYAEAGATPAWTDG